MEIVIASPGMPTGPDTLDHFSLGGSETAALCMAKELKARGHLVTLFCNLPPKDRADYIEPGSTGADGVRYVPLEALKNFIATTEVDLFVASRDPRLIYEQIPQASKTVLWLHDLATYNHFAPQVQGASWMIDEFWCVSEYHKQQVAKVCGLPLDAIKVTRNGISRVDVDYENVQKKPNQLLYAARPERGLLSLVRPGGIMERLPEYNLVVTTYDNFPEHMKDLYNYLFMRCNQLPNVRLLPPRTQAQLRHIMAESQFYVYPTQFEEVSCIIARECAEQHLPFIHSGVGALPETVGLGGITVDPAGLSIDSDEYAQKFADEVRGQSAIPSVFQFRADLYWDGVAEQWEGWATPNPSSLYSQVRSMIEDADIIPAIALLDEAKKNLKETPGLLKLRHQIEELYPYLFGKESFHDYYARYYVLEDEKGARGKPRMEGNQRFEAISEQIAALPEGARVLDYGCAEGVISNTLAKRFPDKKFLAVDFNDGNIQLARKYAAEDGSKNIEHLYIQGTEDIKTDHFDAVICSEVLEHVTEPWGLISTLEKMVKFGGRVVITVPAGPWEASGLYDARQWYWRAHIWHVNKWMLRKMFADKEDIRLAMQFVTQWRDGRILGHLIVSYKADHVPAHAVDPLEKALQHRSRQTIGAAIIAHNSEADIIRCLDSINVEVQQVHIAISSGTTDKTERAIIEWGARNPWIDLKIKYVPAIKPREYGFDDARNASAKDLETDWVLWIDTDEYLSGLIWRYARNNAFDAYAISQHHFTVEPRGIPAQIDKPARLYRNNGTFTFFGKVHEHAEKGFNGGPGTVMLLGDVDIGHVGYVNEATRRGRFGRNFPLLEWDREVFPDRNIGRFLWFRDMVHRMRMHGESGDRNGMYQLALDAKAFYDQWAEKFEYIGGGFQTSQDYYGEVLSVLGLGIPFEITAKLDANNIVQYRGVADEPDVALRHLRVSLKEALERKKSGYLQ